MIEAEEEKKQIGEIRISVPHNRPKKKEHAYHQRFKKRKKFRRRAAIEPVFGYLKAYFRMGENYLHGEKSPQINALLSAAAWNFKKWMDNIQKKFFISSNGWDNYYLTLCENLLFKDELFILNPER